MSRLNHSPGPWRIIPPTDGQRIVNIETMTAKVVAEIELFPKQRAPQANAYLIAAAPEMLEVLIGLNAILDLEHIGVEKWNALQAVLRKASKGQLGAPPKPMP